VTAELPAARQAEIRTAIAGALRDHVDATGQVVLDGSIGVVTARALANG
jgi:hypothetical protein